ADRGSRAKRAGVPGAVWCDTLSGREPAQPAVGEWGGSAYALAALDASLGDDWQSLPLVKVGRDLASRANGFLRTLRHLTPDTRFIAVPEPNNPVPLRHYSTERRCPP